MIDLHAAHQRLITESGMLLGTILWRFLSSDQKLQRAMRGEQEKTSPSRVSFTEFGKEVGRDNVFWWIHKRAPDVDELLKKTQDVLPAAQTLKESSTLNKRARLERYSELIDVLVEFLTDHQHEIRTLTEFVDWLFETDDLYGPAILFSYRVWGSTRMADRLIEIPLNDDPASEHDVLVSCIEIACGVRRRNFYTYHHEMLEIDYDHHEADPEHYSGPAVSEATVMRRAGIEILDEFAEFFTMIRDSLREIELEAENFVAAKDLLSSPSFWRKFIEFISNPDQQEDELWDVKQTLAMWEVPRERRADARFEFCKDLAAFANHEGGALIIGVTNTNREVVGVRDHETRHKMILEVLGDLVDQPQVDRLVRVLPVPYAEEGGSRVCLVIVVAQAGDVVGVRDERGHYAYPLREGPGTTYPPRERIERRKRYQHAGDNFGFMKRLEAMINDH